MLHFNIYDPLTSCKKSENFNDWILRKSQKKLFLGHFCPIWPKTGQKIFFWKIRLRHIVSTIDLHHHAKNHKISSSQSREKLVTDERTNERTDKRTNTGEFIGPSPLRGRSNNILTLLSLRIQHKLCYMCRFSVVIIAKK